MNVIKDCVVTLDYSVADPDGNVVDPGREPLVYLHGGYDDIFPMIEEALHGKGIGDSVTIKMQPEDAFGEYDADLVQVEPRDRFPEHLEVGMQFEGASESHDDDDDDVIVYRVTEIGGGKVVLDGNHPLAGTALVFTCTVTAVRPASSDELAHGHVHDADDEEGHACH